MKIGFSVFVLSLILSIVSCTDPCDDVDCGSNGTCDDGTCLCDPAYSGTFCEVENRSLLYGTYTPTARTCATTTFVQVDQVVIAGGNALDPNELNFTILSNSQTFGPFDARSTDDGLSFNGTGVFFTTTVTIDAARNVAGDLETNIKFSSDMLNTDCTYILI